MSRRDISHVVLDPRLSSQRGRSGNIDQVRYDRTNLGMPQHRISKIRIKSFVVQNQSWNIVNYGPVGGLTNNRLVLNGSPLSLPPGNYDAVSFISAIVALFNATGSGVYTGSIDPLTLLLTISCTLPFTLDFTREDSPYWEMGFGRIATPPGVSFTGSYPINLSGPREIFINIPEVTGDSYIFYGLTPFLFCYPLTGQSPSLSQLNVLDAGKLDCVVGSQQVASLTIQLWFTRDGQVWPYMAYADTTYALMLEMIG